MTPYSTIRPFMRVGDIIGCRGTGLISRLIRKFKGGQWDFSHVAIVIRDTTNADRVEVLEALSNGGLQRNFLSAAYKEAHGSLHWIKMDCEDAQRAEIIELGAQLLQSKVKYDFKSTFLAMFIPIFVDVTKFNCSELGWYLLTKVGRLLKRFDHKDREIAPVPGDFPTWSGIKPISIS